MNSPILYTSRTEVRQKPENLQEQDLPLFEHEFSAEIHETTFLKLTHASILRDLIFSLQNFRFYPEFTHILSVSKKYMRKRMRLFLRPYKTLDKGIWITDEWSAEYFHWFTDALTRLTALEKAISAPGSDPPEGQYKIILPQSYKEKAYIRESLQLLNYQAYYYNPRKRLQVKNLIVPSHTAPTGNYNSVLINQLSSKFLKAIPGTASRNIYISRAKGNKRKVTNEQQVTDLLLQYNYEIHFFEAYDFLQQVEIMSQTRSLIGVHGAGLTNMLFMPKGGHILELRNEGDAHNNCYFSMASALNHHYYYLTNAGDTEDTHNVNLTVDLIKLKSALEFMASKS